jgi:PD-(D/E)XK nuclease superfamily protein
MAALPEPTHGTPQAIHLLHAVKAAAEESRPYLGWSEIGHPCERYLWLRWRWAEREQIDGRMARLFDTGHREEARVLDELRALGCRVWDRDPATGEQFAVASVGGHLRGHLDAVVEGLPEAPKTPHLVDVKTINAKRFKEIVKKSMKNVFPKYWAQAHGYMGHVKLDRAMFIFACKDDDQIHVERFEFDPAVFALYEARAERIVRSAEPPARIAESADDDECKYCAMRELCHGTAAPMVNCRTCAHATPLLDGDGWWHCSRHDGEIGERNQRQGCGDHRFIPIMLERFAKPVDSDGDAVRYALADGREFVNGAPPAGLTSAEIRAAVDKRFLVDADVQQLRERFPAARIAA